jgi:hypothetical protein
MQQIRATDEATRIPDTENMRLMLSDRPDQTWIARFREIIAATEGGPGLKLRVEGNTLVFECADRADLLPRCQLIGQLIERTNGPQGTR